MGIPGLLKEIGKGERIALSKLSVQHLEKTNRPLRVAIDAAIWNFQTQAGQGGKNPALRTLFYRLLRILALPIDPVFVYDGKDKPLTKRGKTVSRYHGTCLPNEASKRLIRLFQFPCHVAAGEAEAECAFLQTHGIVDAVMSQDVDAIMFGSKLTLRDWSHDGAKGNKSPTHVSVLDEAGIKSRSGLDSDGMILVALLSGGDYDESGVPGVGAALACEIARAGFGKDLLDVIRAGDESSVKEWRERLQYELETNESGYFRTKHKSLTIPTSFPDRNILKHYINPATSHIDHLPSLQKQWEESWGTPIRVAELRDYVADMFEWQYKPGAFKLVRTLAPSLLSYFLRRKDGQQFIKSTDQIFDRRTHFETDGLPELRISMVPAEVVGIDLDKEEDSPEYLASLQTEQDEGIQPSEEMADPELVDSFTSSLASPTKSRKSPPWNPYIMEKIWVPETIVRLGVPELTEEWDEIQRALKDDPKLFATRKCQKLPKGQKKKLVQSNTLDSFIQTGTLTTLSTAGSPIKRTIHVKNSVNTFFKASKPQAHATGEPLKRPTTGSSYHDSIEISSSPISGGSVEQLLNDKTIISLSQEPITDNDISLSPAVTLRKKKAAKPHHAVAIPQAADNPREPRPRPIASFFGPRPHPSDIGTRDSSSDVVSTEQDLPSDLTTGLRTNLNLERKLAQPRESLQGAWKELSGNEDMFGGFAAVHPSRRPPRISHIDLTGD